MKACVKLALLAALFLSATGQPASASSWGESPLAQADFGDLWSGEAFETADLAGKVVLVMVWGDKCGYCVRALPGLASYEKIVRDRGLIVVGACCKDDKSNALKVSEKAKVDFAIVHKATLPGSKQMRALPSFVLYDRNGQIVYQEERAAVDQEGPSGEFRTAIENALGSSIDVLIIDLGQYREKSVLRFAKKARKAKGLGRLLTRIDETIAGGTDAEKAEAERLKEQVIAYGQQMLARAAKERENRPHRHFDMLKQIAKAFRGHDIGAQADAVYKPLKRDKEAKKEIAAARLYDELQTAPEKEKKSIYKKIEKKYAETRFGKRALAERKTDEG